MTPEEDISAVLNKVERQHRDFSEIQQNRQRPQVYERLPDDDFPLSTTDRYSPFYIPPLLLASDGERLSRVNQDNNNEAGVILPSGTVNEVSGADNSRPNHPAC